MLERCLELVHVEIRSDGITSSVLIDGVDYSMRASSITFHHEAGHIPVVRLELPIGSLSVTGRAGLRLLGSSENGEV